MSQMVNGGAKGEEGALYLFIPIYIYLYLYITLMGWEEGGNYPALLSLPSSIRLTTFCTFH